MTISWLCVILTFLRTSNTCAAGPTDFTLLLNVSIGVAVFYFHNRASLWFLNNICQDHAKTRASLAPKSPQQASKNILLEETPFLYTCLPVRTHFSFQPTSSRFYNCIRALAALISLNGPDKLITKIINCFSLKAL